MSRKIILGGFFLAVVLYAPASFGATKVANDPMRIGVGARALGMGKSYVALTDDLTGIFVNPAALAGLDQWQATTMQGKFINEYNYLNLGGAAPSRLGGFGLGYVGGKISFSAPAATTEVVDGVRIIPSSTEGVSYSFLDSVILFSWGSQLKGLLGLRVFDHLSAGATFKIFALNLSGPGISQGAGGGNELDLGLNFRPNTVFKAGVVLQNALPFSAGGRIRWDNGTEETLPSVIKPGLSLRLLGENGFRRLGRHELSLNLDADYTPLRPAVPDLFHFGLEWAPVELLALRVGIDQDYLGKDSGKTLEPANNFTAGVGLTFGQFRFDYAYHQYNQLTDNDTHYFSLTYGIGRRKAKKPGPPFAILPRDKTIIFTSEVAVKGTVLNDEIKLVKVAGRRAPIAKGVFEAGTPLKPGRNSIVVEGFRDKKLIGRTKVRLLRLKPFRDVAADYWAATPISILAMEGVISGYPDGTFRPEGRITRAEFAKLLMNTQGISGSRPKDQLTRAEGVAMISRFAKLPEPRSLEVPFADVPGRHWAAKEIIKAKEAGILEYLLGKPFEPGKPLTRGEVAEMLSKTPPLSEKVNKILDWNRGY